MKVIKNFFVGMLLSMFTVSLRIRQYNNNIGKVKSEVIKEFAERFEDEMGEDFFEHYPFVLTALDNVAEEMINQLTRIEHDSLCKTETYKTREERF